jgi:Family of unknown function (DUF5519)
VNLEGLRRDLSSIEGVVEGRSRFADRAGWWVENTEIAHFDEDDVLDIRLTAAVIRRRRGELAAHPEITFRRSSGADWLEIRISSPGTERLAFELAKEAAEANRRQSRSGRVRRSES